MTLSLRATVLLGVALCALVARDADAQGRITGTVTDSQRTPVPDVDVILRPIGRRAKTDSTGRFSFTKVSNGTYSLAARKLGFAPEFYEVALSSGGSVTVNVVLGTPLRLDTIRVAATAVCAVKTLDGFFCRRRAAKGLFLDYPDIDDFGETRTADVFRHVKGFGVELRSTWRGWEPFPERRPARCTMYLVNGHIVAGWDFVPQYTKMLSAIEIYLRPDSVPANILQEMRFYPSTATAAQANRCDAVVFWTIDAPLRPWREYRVVDGRR